ncbi:hypothetical protein Daesc_003365 [Daldinia eschscholtzii]|uniref:Uncharacterized protein n=1 Tax=Daldinia eschscholtzii TaxID=292717 RepID=A0AAX6MU71_9PEZI
MADEISSSTGATVRILTQDPDYVDETREILKEHGLEAQVIADIARPALIIAAEQGDIFTQTDSPYDDPESLHTLELWQG